MNTWVKKLLRLAIMGLLLLLVWSQTVGFFALNKAQPLSVAFWLQHDFVEPQGGPWKALEAALEEHSVDTLYFHVGPIQKDGSLPPLSIPNLQSLPTQNLAWMGQLRSEINLDDPTVRAGILASARAVVAGGFDGIQLNIEPVRREDAAFVDLLRELRQDQPQLFISVATDEWQPHGLSQWVAKWLETPIESYWSTEQVEEVAKWANELVVMTYDTKMDNPDHYRWWVMLQTRALSRRLPKDVALRVGLPVYEEGAGINPVAENLHTGLQGYHMAMSNSLTQKDQVHGIALYPFWEMQEHEWAELNDYEHHFDQWIQELR